MKEIVLPVEKRATRGKGGAREERRNGRIPAVVYGPEIDSYAVAVSEKELRAALKQASGATVVFDLTLDGKVDKVLVRDLQIDPVTSKVLHVDFHAVSMNKPIHTTIPISFVGEPSGVKTDGGIMQTTMRDLAISCLPAEIPDKIVVDVTDLGIGDSIHVRELEVPGAKILTEEQRTVVVISAPTIAKVETTEEEAAEGEEGAEGEAAEGDAEGAAEGEAPAEGDKKEKKEEKK
jgi:large subunit ribosomal protein L25